LPVKIKSFELAALKANFSASGLERQDNDLIVIKDAEAAAQFKQVFEARFASGETLSLWRRLVKK
jgi:hypothetical protein